MSGTTGPVHRQTTVTCPECGHAEPTTMPANSCQLAYVCPRCRALLHPREGDCCVFCSYGTRPCPFEQ